MNILLLSLGGGGGNILRSVKALYSAIWPVTEQTDTDVRGPVEEQRGDSIRRYQSFSLVDVPDEERVMIGAATTGHLGARHDPRFA